MYCGEKDIIEKNRKKEFFLLGCCVGCNYQIITLQIIAGAGDDVDHDHHPRDVDPG